MAKTSKRPDKKGAHRQTYELNKRRIMATQDICGICGNPIDPELKYPHPMAGCVDHIIPIAKGGHPSDIANLQKAHWYCNRQKSDKIIKATASPAIEEEVIDNRQFPQSFDWKNY